MRRINETLSINIKCRQHMVRMFHLTVEKLVCPPGGCFLVCLHHKILNTLKAGPLSFISAPSDLGIQVVLSTV